MPLRHVSPLSPVFPRCAVPQGLPCLSTGLVAPFLVTSSRGTAAPPEQGPAARLGSQRGRCGALVASPARGTAPGSGLGGSRGLEGSSLVRSREDRQPDRSPPSPGGQPRSVSLTREGCRAPWLGDGPRSVLLRGLGVSGRVSLVTGLGWRPRLGVSPARSHRTRWFGSGRARAAWARSVSAPCAGVRVAAGSGDTRRGLVCTIAFLAAGTAGSGLKPPSSSAVAGGAVVGGTGVGSSRGGSWQGCFLQPSSGAGEHVRRRAERWGPGAGGSSSLGLGCGDGTGGHLSRRRRGSGRTALPCPALPDVWLGRGSARRRRPAREGRGRTLWDVTRFALTKKERKQSPLAGPWPAPRPRRRC